jgi:hypothetical protein
MFLQKVLHDFLKLRYFLRPFHCVLMGTIPCPPDLVVQSVLPLFPIDNLLDFILLLSFCRYHWRRLDLPLMEVYVF